MNRQTKRQKKTKSSYREKEFYAKPCARFYRSLFFFLSQVSLAFLYSLTELLSPLPSLSIENNHPDSVISIYLPEADLLLIYLFIYLFL